MTVKTRDLDLQVHYVFNGIDFVINKNISRDEYVKVFENCTAHQLFVPVEGKGDKCIHKVSGQYASSRKK